jgi:hypothetical protein
LEWDDERILIFGPEKLSENQLSDLSDVEALPSDVENYVAKESVGKESGDEEPPRKRARKKRGYVLSWLSPC